MNLIKFSNRHSKKVSDANLLYLMQSIINSIIFEKTKIINSLCYIILQLLLLIY